MPRPNEDPEPARERTTVSLFRPTYDELDHFRAKDESFDDAVQRLLQIAKTRTTVAPSEAHRATTAD